MVIGTLVCLLFERSLYFFFHHCCYRRLCPDISFFQIATKYPNKKVTTGKREPFLTLKGLIQHISKNMGKETKKQSNIRQ